MEASTGPLILPTPPPRPNLENIKKKLVKNGINPTPKIIHTLRKKELQKSNRRIAKHAAKQPPPLTDTKKLVIEEESNLQIIQSEYKKFTKSLKSDENEKLVGRPWERLEMLRLRELATQNAEYCAEKLNPEHLRELSDIIECERDKFSWILSNDIEVEEGWFEEDGRRFTPRKRSESEAIKFLIDRLSETELSMKDWKFSRMMRQSGLQFTEGQMLKIVEGLGGRKQWRHALSIVEWVYNSKEHKQYKSRFVYTKLLAVLGRAGKPREALHIFNLMRGDAYIYPDMAAYHSLAVTLGQAGFLKELLNVIESMKEKPKKIRYVKHKSWDPVLQPDIVIFNAVLNACVRSCEWKGVSWVFEQLRKNGLRPNGASYGLAMEVMLQSGRYDLVHEFFGRMKRSGEALKALTYKVLVKAFWKEGKVDEAVRAVRDMERRGIIGIASVYYELARCLCFYGKWEEAILEIEKLKKLRPTKPLAVTFTGMILSSMDGGHVQDCISLFEHCKTQLAPDIGIVNAMLKVYRRNDMFLKAKELFEKTKKNDLSFEISIKPDAYTFGAMLEASASALQWEYFEYVYKEMTLSGYQMDLNKHSGLLVEASRSGKCHLLEHAFDTLLESGEIPPISIFSEMVCQSTAQHDYKRALNLINAMAHAPFQLTFQEWIRLFETNRDRINQASLNELYETLVRCDLVKEPTVLNLSRALKFICRDSINSSNSSGNSIVSDTIPSDTCDGEFDVSVCEGDSLYKACASRLFNSVSKISEYYEDCDLEHVENRDGQESDVDEFELFFPSSDIDDDCDDDLPESDIPSAYEILKSWKEMSKE